MELSKTFELYRQMLLVEAIDLWQRMRKKHRKGE